MPMMTKRLLSVQSQYLPDARNRTLTVVVTEEDEEETIVQSRDSKKKLTEVAKRMAEKTTGTKRGTNVMATVMEKEIEMIGM